jgi:hypothetical protein
LGKNKKEKYVKGSAIDHEFTAYIIRGNRQVIERQVNASRKFRIGDDTYMIKQDCIFLKNIEGYLQSVSVYTEGNPYPHHFKLATKKMTRAIKKQVTSKDGKKYWKKIKDEHICNEGEPIPNEGIPEKELNDWYGGDMFTILVEGQERESKTNWSLYLLIIILMFGVLTFVKNIILAIML